MKNVLHLLTFSALCAYNLKPQSVSSPTSLKETNDSISRAGSIPENVTHRNDRIAKPQVEHTFFLDFQLGWTKERYVKHQAALEDLGRTHNHYYVFHCAIENEAYLDIQPKFENDRLVEVVLQGIMNLPKKATIMQSCIVDVLTAKYGEPDFRLTDTAKINRLIWNQIQAQPSLDEMKDIALVWILPNFNIILCMPRLAVFDYINYTKEWHNYGLPVMLFYSEKKK